MRAVLALVLGLIAFQGGPAAAQEATIKETRCWVGDVAFTAGVGINAGDGVAVCRAGTGWEAGEATTPVVGCVLEDKFSSVGAIVGIRNNDSLLLQCDATGRWTPVNTGIAG
jgi:hypothetical protein